MEAKTLIILASLTGMPPVERSSDQYLINPQPVISRPQQVSHTIAVCARPEATVALYRTFRQEGSARAGALYRDLVSFGICLSAKVGMHQNTWTRCRQNVNDGCGRIMLGAKTRDGKPYFAVIFPGL